MHSKNNTFLCHNNKLGHNYCSSKIDFSARLLKFMDIKTESTELPGNSYILTQDNFMKIMAIQTRFRFDFNCRRLSYNYTLTL